MRRWPPLLALALAGTLLAPAAARGGDDAAATLARLTAGRTAGAPVACIFSEQGVNIEIVPRAALGFYVADTTYISRFADGCPALARDRRILVSPLNGRLCRDDAVRIVDATGRTGYGFCPLGAFEPWRKPPGGRR